MKAGELVAATSSAEGGRAVNRTLRTEAWTSGATVVWADTPAAKAARARTLYCMVEAEGSGRASVGRRDGEQSKKSGTYAHAAAGSETKEGESTSSERGQRAARGYEGGEKDGWALLVRAAGRF